MNLLRWCAHLRAPVARFAVGARMFSSSSSFAQVRAAMVIENAASLPEGVEWKYEYAWAGDRVLAQKEGANVRLSAVQHHRDLTNRFPVIAAAVAKLDADTAVIEGVVTRIEPALAQLLAESIARSTTTAIIRLIATDLLWLDGVDQRPLPLIGRKERLRRLAAGSDILIGPELAPPLNQMLREALRLGADGVIAKRADSRYRPFGRIGDWVRVSAMHSAPNASLSKPPRGWSRARGIFGGGDDTPPPGIRPAFI